MHNNIFTRISSNLLLKGCSRSALSANYKRPLLLVVIRGEIFSFGFALGREGGSRLWPAGTQLSRVVEGLVLSGDFHSARNSVCPGYSMADENFQAPDPLLPVKLVNDIPARFLQALRFWSRLPLPSPSFEADPHAPPDMERLAPVLPFAAAVL